jgi:hypothetical protein
VGDGGGTGIRDDAAAAVAGAANRRLWLEVKEGVGVVHGGCLLPRRGRLSFFFNTMAAGGGVAPSCVGLSREERVSRRWGCMDG